MGCVNCKKIRDAVLHGKMADAAGLTVEMFREKFGLSVEGEPLVDASELPSLSRKTKDELLTIAEQEGAEVEYEATNAQIIEAIEKRREVIAA